MKDKNAFFMLVGCCVFFIAANAVGQTIAPGIGDDMNSLNDTSIEDVQKIILELQGKGNYEPMGLIELPGSKEPVIFNISTTEVNGTNMTTFWNVDIVCDPNLLACELTENENIVEETIAIEEMNKTTNDVRNRISRFQGMATELCSINGGLSWC